jgi:hypothetical protein
MGVSLPAAAVAKFTISTDCDAEANLGHRVTLALLRYQDRLASMRLHQSRRLQCLA